MASWAGTTGTAAAKLIPAQQERPVLADPDYSVGGRGSGQVGSIGEEVALWDTETDALMGTMKVTEKYSIDKEYECKQIFRTNDPAHPGVQKVMEQGAVNLAGPVKVLSESYYPEMFKGIYQRPAEARKVFDERGWSTVAALQLRNPMHNSHAYLAWIAIEVCDGVYIHQMVGKLKPGDIPAEVRVKAIDALVNKYFRKDRVIQGGYPDGDALCRTARSLAARRFPPELRLHPPDRGPRPRRRWRLLRSVRRAEDLQRNPAGVAGLAAAVHGLDLLLLRVRAMASMKTCPHESKAVIDENGKYKGGARLLLSGTAAQTDERRQAGSGRVLPARGDRGAEGVLRHAEEEER